MNKGLYQYGLSNSKCFYFHKGLLSNGRIIYLNGGNLNPRIKLWGQYFKDTWHFAIRGRIVFEPVLHYVVNIHILSKTKSGLKSAPKGVYKRWFNDTYKNRLRAAIIHCAEKSDCVRFEVGRGKEVLMLKSSVIFNNPVSYDETKVVSEEGNFASDEFSD